MGKFTRGFYERFQEIDIACDARDMGTFLENFESERSFLCGFDASYEPNRSNALSDARMRIEKGAERLESCEGYQHDGYVWEVCVLR